MPIADPTTTLDGVLVVDKPRGLTSHDVVSRVRRATGCRRVGHTGTLDPLATGVLPLVLGRATRLARFLSGQNKEYDAAIVLGRATDTCDAEGAVVSSHEGPLPGVDQVAAAIDRLRDEKTQVPPAFSAKKVAGVRAYRLARRNEAPALAPVPVDLGRADLVGYDPPEVRVRLTVSAGFYVRAFARDLGASLGCGAHLCELRRTRSGDFDLDQAVGLAALLDRPELAARRLLPLRHLLPQTDVVHLSPRGAWRARHGNLIDESDCESASRASGVGPVRLIDPEGRLAALASAGTPGWPLHPDIVLD